MAAGLRFHTEAGLLTSFITALPFPVSQWIARPLPYTVTASLRIPTGFPFHLLLSRHLCATTLYFSRQRDYITFCELSIRSDGGSLKSIDSCMPDLLLSQCILPTVSARSREAPCRLSAPALACLFSGIFFIVQQVGHIPQADAQGGPVVQQCRGGGRQYPRHAQCDQRQVEAHDEAVAAVDALH